MSPNPNGAHGLAIEHIRLAFYFSGFCKCGEIRIQGIKKCDGIRSREWYAERGRNTYYYGQKYFFTSLPFDHPHFIKTGAFKE
ncbi:MAG: hypothetical protein ACREKL_05655 [Chthoniobacterales bacterium]